MRARVLGCDLAGTNVHALPPHGDAIVVIGSEGRGLSAAVRQSVTYYVTLCLEWNLCDAVRDCVRDVRGKVRTGSSELNHGPWGPGASAAALETAESAAMAFSNRSNRLGV